MENKGNQNEEEKKPMYLRARRLLPMWRYGKDHFVWSYLYISN